MSAQNRLKDCFETFVFDVDCLLQIMNYVKICFYSASILFANVDAITLTPFFFQIFFFELLVCSTSLKRTEFDTQFERRGLHAQERL